jgi:hypothetical protein
MKLIAIDAEALDLIVQELNSGMIVGPAIAKSLRELMATAKPAADPELFADMVLEMRATGECRGPLHVSKKQEGKPCECRPCRIRRRLP